MSREDLILYLKQYLTLDKTIDRKFETVEKLQDAASRITPSYEPKVKGGSVYKAGNALAAKADLERSLLDDLNQMVDLRREIGALFDQVEDPRQRLLLLYRYIDGLTFEQIAGEIELSLTYTFRLHKAALEEVLLIWAAPTKC